MKRILMVLVMVTVLASAAVMSGCGAAMKGTTGAVVTGVMTGTQMALQQQEEDLIAQQAAALERIANAASEAEKLAAQAEHAAIEKKLQETESELLALKAAQAATTTDWTDPTAVGGLSTAAAVVIMGALLNRKKKTG